jgi:hypothetical protein
MPTSGQVRIATATARAQHGGRRIGLMEVVEHLDMGEGLDARERVRAESCGRVRCGRIRCPSRRPWA